MDGKLVSSALLPDGQTLVDLSAPVGENYSAGEYYIGSNKADQGAESCFNRYYKGVIDDVRIYDRDLTPIDIWFVFEYSADS
jgi:hypothetical protein